MNREKIILLALRCGDTPIGGLHTFCVEGLERFAAAIEAEQAEIIAAQQARIAELVDGLKSLLNGETEVLARSAIYRTDDLSALNEAKAQVLDDVYGILEKYCALELPQLKLAMDEISRMDRELRAKK